jgi:hypothetical protein
MGSGDRKSICGGEGGLSENAASVQLMVTKTHLRYSVGVLVAYESFQYRLLI